LQGMVGQGACRIRSVTYTNATAASIATYETSDDPAALVAQTQVDIPWDNQIRDLEVWNQASNAQASLRFLGAGAGTSFLGNELLLVDATVRASGPAQDGKAVDGCMANYFSTGGYCWVFGETRLRNVAGFWPLGAQLGAVTMDYQAAAPYGEPADNGNYGIAGKSSYFTGAVVMTNGGRIGGDPALSHRFESTITATGTGASVLRDCTLLGNVSLGAGTAVLLIGGVKIGTVSGAGTFLRTLDTDYASASAGWELSGGTDIRPATAAKNIIPNTSGSLGTAAAPWGGLRTAGGTFTGNLLVGSDLSYTLGSGTARWNKANVRHCGWPDNGTAANRTYWQFDTLLLGYAGGNNTVAGTADGVWKIAGSACRYSLDPIAVAPGNTGSIGHLYAMNSIDGYADWYAAGSNASGITRHVKVTSHGELAIEVCIPFTTAEDFGVVEVQRNIWGSLSAVTAGSVNTVPTTISVPNVNRGHVLINVTGGADTTGNLVLSGTSYNESTGAETGADTETLAVAGTGWYRSTKHWVGTVVVSSAAGPNDVDLTADCYTASHKLLGFGEVRKVIRAIADWTPSNVVNTLEIVIKHFDRSAKTFTDILNTDTPVPATIASANYLDAGANGVPNRFQIGLATTFDEADGDFMLVYANGKSIQGLNVQLCHEPA